MHNISEPMASAGSALLQLGFRPFFLAAAIFSILATALWLGIYVLDWRMQLLGLAPMHWHAHEMLFGYLLAVVAGFLLTAVKNWTGRLTLQGHALLGLAATWAAARLLPIFNIGTLELMAILDGAFLAMLVISISLPILRARQWLQTGILLLLISILLSNMLFYAGALGYVENGATLGLHSGFYLILMLVLVMARRVIPFFIEHGTGRTKPLLNMHCVDRGSLMLLAALWLADVIYHQPIAIAVVAGVLFFLHTIRVIGWYTHGIWSSSMLWVLYLGYLFLVSGFALKATSAILDIPSLLSLHAFAYGGISTLTLGMMSRVALGHTGRDVLRPPAALPYAFALILAGAVIRVYLPLLFTNHYNLLVAVSQALWIMAFAVFLVIFYPILTSPRVDGKPG